MTIPGKDHNAVPASSEVFEHSINEAIIAEDWGLWGHAQTNDELVSAAREEIAKFKSA
jgi:hypothetical protein